MRVCVLMPFLDVYKGGNHLLLFRALPDVQFTVLTSHVRLAAEGAVLPPNVEVQMLPARLGPFYYGVADWRFARAVLRTYPVAHPFWKAFDLLHLNQTLGPQFLCLTQTGVPVLYAIHHPVTADREVAIAESAGWKRLLWRTKYFFPVRWQRRLCRSIPHVMTVSATVRDRLVRDFGIEPEKIFIVFNGVDGDRFVKKEDVPPEFDVVAIGSFLHPRKGFPYLREVYRLLTDQGIRIADVGKRSSEQREALEQMKGVTAFGTVPDERIIELVQRSSVLLSTSLYEGFGLSLIEALACGRPAFAFDGGAVGEVLAPIDSQLIVPLRDSAEMVRRVVGFLHLSSDERKQRGVRYRQEVLERYSLSASAEALRGVYESLKNASLHP